MLERLVELFREDLSDRVLKRLSGTKLADDALREAGPLLAGTWPQLRDGELPHPGERLRAFITVAEVQVYRLAGGDWRRAPSEFARAVLAFAHVHRAQPEAVPAGFLRGLFDHARPDKHDMLASWQAAAGGLFGHAKSSRELISIDAALVVGTGVLAATAVDDPQYPLSYEFLFLANRLRFELTDDTRDEDEAIRRGRDALDATPEGDAALARRLLALGSMLNLKANRLGDPHAMQDAVPLLRRALMLTGSDESTRAQTMSALSSALIMSTARGSDVGELDEAIDLTRQLQELPVLAHTRDLPLAILAGLLTQRFARRRDLDVLDEAIAVYQELHASTEPGDDRHGEWCGELGRHLFYRQQLVHDPAVLSEAMALMLAAVRESGVDRFDDEMLAALAAGLVQQYLHPDDLTTLDEVIQALEDVTSPGRRHADNSQVLNRLSLLLRARLEVAGDTGLLDRIEAVSRRALAASAPDAKRHAEHLSSVGAALIFRYRHDGDLAVLDDAVDISRRAVLGSGPDRDNYGDLLFTLALALRERYHRTRHLASLTEAIEATEQLRDMRLPEADWVSAVNNLASMLNSRSDHTGDIADAERARWMLAEAIAGLPADHGGQVLLRGSLATVLLSIARHSGNDDVLAEAVAQLELIVQSPAATRWLRQGLQNNLANALFARFHETRDPATLDRVIELCQALIAELPADAPGRENTLMGLGQALMTRMPISKDEADGREAERVFRELAANPVIPAIPRAFSAAMVASLAESDQRLPDALDAARAGIDLLPLVTWHGADRSDHELLLPPFGHLTRYAAGMALDDGDPEQAIELLEHGRGALAAHALETRTELTDLALHAPALAARLEHIRAELDQPATSPDWQRGALTPGALATGVTSDHRHRLAREWNEVLDEVHGLPGFQDFLRPPRFAQLVRAAEQGPVVVINMNSRRCDALLLTDTGVRVCPLTELSTKDAEEQVEVLLEETTTLGRAHSVADRVVADTLDWLWRVVAEPVLHELGISGPPAPEEAWPRIWWCPTGPLVFLPLHAAASVTGDAVLDRAVSSYTPNISALLRAKAAPRPETTKALTVAVSELAGHPPLLGARREAVVLESLLGGTMLTGACASLERLRNELASHSWVHFACHGVQDIDEPSSGRLFLSDGEFRVADIARLRLGGAELAFLSACETAVGGSRLPDEAIHLTGALQLAGFTHVIGTMWRVDDDYAVEMAEHVYRFLAAHGAEDGLAVAQALHHAVRALREETPERPTAWAAHIHAGP